MVEHVVLMRLAANVDQGRVDAMSAKLLALREQIPGITRIVVGLNTSPEGLGQGYDLGFVVTFVDQAARDAYLPHPAHLAVVPLVQEVAEAVLVFDFEERGS